MLEKITKKSFQQKLEFKFYNSINELPEINWNNINTENEIFFSTKYLQVLENTLSENIQFKYILFFKDQQPVAFAVTQLIKFNTDQQKFNSIPCNIGESVKNKILSNLDIKVLICGNLFTCGEHGFVFNNQKIDSQTAFDTLSDALRELRKLENSDKPSFILVKEFFPKSASKVKLVLEEHKFRTFEIDVNMVLQIQLGWKSFEDYLASMRTKFRTRAKSVLKKSEALEVRDLNAEEINNYSVEIDKLYASVLQNADFKVGKLNTSTFYNLKLALGDLFIFKSYFLEGKLIGFTTAFVSKTTVEANHIGINYDFNKTYNIYQKMLYDYVDLAISKNVNELHLGRTAEIIKSTIGAKPVPMKLFVRHGNSISNKLLKPLVELISPNEYEIRNPFKLETTS